MYLAFTISIWWLSFRVSSSCRHSQTQPSLRKNYRGCSPRFRSPPLWKGRCLSFWASVFCAVSTLLPLISYPWFRIHSPHIGMENMWMTRVDLSLSRQPLFSMSLLHLTTPLLILLRSRQEKLHTPTLGQKSYPWWSFALSPTIGIAFLQILILVTLPGWATMEGAWEVILV